MLFTNQALVHEYFVMMCGPASISTRTAKALSGRGETMSNNTLEGFCIKGRDKREREVNDELKTTYKVELKNRDTAKTVIYTEKKWVHDLVMNDDVDIALKQSQKTITEAVGVPECPQ
jgi:ferredoxin-NADP reductase